MLPQLYVWLRICREGRTYEEARRETVSMKGKTQINEEGECLPLAFRNKLIPGQENEAVIAQRRT